MSGKMTQATYEGRTYSIPDIWIVGFCSRGFTILQAIQHWAYQDQLEREARAFESDLGKWDRDPFFEEV